jgi:hypothetical protein
MHHTGNHIDLRRMARRLREGVAVAGARGMAALHRRRPPPLDFSRTRRWQGPLVAGAWLGAAVAAGTAWQDWMAMAAQARQAQALQQRFTRLSEQQSRQLKARMLRLPEQQRQLAAFAALHGDVLVLADAIGQALTADTALTTVDIQAAEGAASIELEARDMASAFRYLEALQAVPGATATLTQSALKPDDPQQQLALKLRVVLVRK